MKEQTPTGKRRKYDAFFKQEVVNMIMNGRSLREISRSLGIGENLIYRWKSGAKISSAAAEEGCKDQAVLYQRIRELEVERDILKKALLIFSHQT